MPRAPAYARAVMARRAAGERIGLLIVAVSDWKACEELALRDNTARVVVPDDRYPHELDWSFAVGLDCLICGNCTEPVFFAVATMLHAAGAASLWCDFDDGIARIEYFPSKLIPVQFVSDPHRSGIPLSGFGKVLASFRHSAVLWREGFYASPAFDGQRQSEWAGIDANCDRIRAEMDRKAIAA